MALAMKYDCQGLFAQPEMTTIKTVASPILRISPPLSMWFQVYELPGGEQIELDISSWNKRWRVAWFRGTMSHACVGMSYRFM
jgi:hypothetical protein